jgi:hypothetical protein
MPTSAEIETLLAGGDPNADRADQWDSVGAR